MKLHLIVIATISISCKFAKSKESTLNVDNESNLCEQVLPRDSRFVIANADSQKATISTVHHIEAGSHQLRILENMETDSEIEHIYRTFSMLPGTVVEAGEPLYFCKSEKSVVISVWKNTARVGDTIFRIRLVSLDHEYSFHSSSVDPFAGSN